MMKKLFLAILIAALMLQAASAAAPALPRCTSGRVSEDEVAAFFADDPFGEVYKALENKSETAYFMNFACADDTLDPYYANWRVYFILTSNKDVHVNLMGAYGAGMLEYMAELKAGEEYNVLGFSIPYSYVFEYVKNFYCAAIPVTEELKAAREEAGVDASDLAGLYNASPDTRLTLSLRITNPDNESEYYDLSADTFVYRPATISGNIPETGDEAQLALWFAMLAVSAIGILNIRRKARREN